MITIKTILNTLITKNMRKKDKVLKLFSKITTLLRISLKKTTMMISITLKEKIK